MDFVEVTWQLRRIVVLASVFPDGLHATSAAHAASSELARAWVGANAGKYASLDLSE